MNTWSVVDVWRGAPWNPISGPPVTTTSPSASQVIPQSQGGDAATAGIADTAAIAAPASNIGIALLAAGVLGFLILGGGR